MYLQDTRRTMPASSFVRDLVFGLQGKKLTASKPEVCATDILNATGMSETNVMPLAAILTLYHSFRGKITDTSPHNS